MKIGYYTKDGGGTIEDTVYADFEVSWTKDPEKPNYWDIEELCQWIYDHNDGWEWLETGVEITVVIDDKEVGDYKITVDYSPEFYVEKRES